MDWQLPLTVTLIAGAAGYLGWRGWRSWRASRTGCGGSCGCAKAPAASENALIPAQQLTVRQVRAK